jgi:plastocyanin
MKFSSKILSSGAATVLLCLVFPLSGLAASTNVTVGSPTDRFSPAVVSINAGDQVIWTWASNSHSTTSGTGGPPSGLWDSGVNNAPHSFTNTFNSAGNFSYYCSIHVSFGMTGSVAVNSVSLPPTLAITNPPNNALFVAPANVTIQAAITNGSSPVTNVQFRVGSTILTNVPAAPFSATTNNLAAGNYTLFAIASDSTGAKATNSVNITVDARPTVTITNPAGGAVLSAPANLTIKASASDSDGTVTNVQILIGSVVLTNVATSPFVATTNNVGANSYTLSAFASDNNGVKNTNSISISVVTPVTVSLTNAASFSGTNFQFSYPANVGLSYVIQGSTNLASGNWISIVTNVAASNPVVFADIHATNTQTFYRVGRLPNP